MKLPTIEELVAQARKRGADPTPDQISASAKILEDAKAAYESGEDTSSWEALRAQQEADREEQAQLKVDAALLAAGEKPLSN